jgi:hypothetical protein
LVAKQRHRFVTIAATGVRITVTKKGSRYIGKGQEERNTGKRRKERNETNTYISPSNMSYETNV